jgi:CheY-like chemotaxis protein
LRREGEFAVMEVEDNGEGIPADMLEGIFSLFAQVRTSLDRAQGGLGIGLYLVRSLVALHGGTVTARSPGPGQGSVFTLRVPCLPALAEPASPQAERAGDLDAKGLKVLVVDDNIDAAETLAMVLEMGGSRIHTVHDGLSVLQAARDFDPDVVLLDIGLPGMSGYEVAEQLRREPRFRDTLLVAITGWGAEQDRRRAHQAGFDHHLTKPVDLAALEPLLRDASAARPAGAPPG